VRSNRNVYLGAHVTRAVKRALVAVARNRKVSVSALVSSVLESDPALTPHIERQQLKLKRAAK